MMYWGVVKTSDEKVIATFAANGIESLEIIAKGRAEDHMRSTHKLKAKYDAFDQFKWRHKSRGLKTINLKFEELEARYYLEYSK